MTSRRFSPTIRARKQEERIAKELGGKRQPGSGNQWHAKADVKTARFLVEAKYTDARRYILKLDDIKKLKRQLLFERCPDWCIQIDFPEGIRVAVVSYELLEELME